jgi:hypothetical protein
MNSNINTDNSYDVLPDATLPDATLPDGWKENEDSDESYIKNIEAQKETNAEIENDRQELLQKNGEPNNNENINKDSEEISKDFQAQLELNLRLLLLTLTKKKNMGENTFINKTIEDLKILKIQDDKDTQKIYDKIIKIIQVLNPSSNDLDILDILLASIISQTQKIIKIMMNFIESVTPSLDQYHKDELKPISIMLQKTTSILNNLLEQMPSLDQAENQNEDHPIGKIEMVELVLGLIALPFATGQIIGGRKTRKGKKGIKCKKSKKNKGSKRKKGKNMRKSKKLIK